MGNRTGPLSCFAQHYVPWSKAIHAKSVWRLQCDPVVGVCRQWSSAARPGWFYSSAAAVFLSTAMVKLLRCSFQCRSQRTKLARPRGMCTKLCVARLVGLVEQSSTDVLRCWLIQAIASRLALVCFGAQLLVERSFALARMSHSAFASSFGARSRPRSSLRGVVCLLARAGGEMRSASCGGCWIVA